MTKLILAGCAKVQTKCPANLIELWEVILIYTVTKKEIRTWPVGSNKGKKVWIEKHAYSLVQRHCFMCTSTDLISLCPQSSNQKAKAVSLLRKHYNLISVLSWNKPETVLKICRRSPSSNNYYTKRQRNVRTQAQKRNLKVYQFDPFILQMTKSILREAHWFSHTYVVS
jgi:hypothetical protein